MLSVLEEEMNRVDVIFNPEHKIIDISVKDSLFIDAALVFNKKKMWFEYKAVLKSLKEFVTNNRLYNNKHFIYFICTRQHIDICGLYLKKNNIIIRYQILRKHKTIKTNREIIQNKFDFEFEKIHYSNGSVYLSWQHKTLVIDIHNFLRTCEINIGEGTKVHYIGYTKNPLSRPINGSHKGLSTVLFQNRNKNLDFFIVYNAFNVNFLNTVNNVVVSVDNKFMHVLSAENEGLLVEKIMINFFLDNNILDNYDKENKELIKFKLKLKEMHYTHLFLTFGFLEKSDYYNFYSNYRSHESIHTYEEKLT